MGVHQRSTNRRLKPLARPLSDKPLGGNYHLNWNSGDDTLKVKWDKSRWVKGNIDFSWTGTSVLDLSLVLLKALNHEYGDSHYQKPCIWPRKLITDPAVLKMKPTIKSMRPGRIAAILPPRVLKPSPTPLATDFRPCQCAHNHSNRCSDYHDNSWYCETVFLEHVSHSLSLSEVPNSSSSLSFSRASIFSWFSIILSHALSVIA